MNSFSAESAQATLEWEVQRFVYELALAALGRALARQRQRFIDEARAEMAVMTGEHHNG